MTVEYRCQHCGNVSTLRNAALINLGLPFAIAAFAFFVAYNILVEANLGMLSAIALVAAVVSIQLIIVCIISRIGSHFDKT
jgi:hypothetical protein